MSWLDPSSSSSCDPAFDAVSSSSSSSSFSSSASLIPQRNLSGPASPDLLQIKPPTRTKEDIGGLFSIAQATLPPKQIKNISIQSNQLASGSVILPPGPKPISVTSDAIPQASDIPPPVAPKLNTIVASSQTLPTSIAAPPGIKKINSLNPSFSTIQTSSKPIPVTSRVNDLEVLLEKEKSLRAEDVLVHEESLNRLRLEFAEKERSLLSVIATKEKDVNDRDEAIGRGRSALVRLKEAGMAAQQRVATLEAELGEAKKQTSISSNGEMISSLSQGQSDPTNVILLETLRSELGQAQLQVSALQENLNESKKTYEREIAELKIGLHEARENANVAAAAAAAAASVAQEAHKIPRSTLLSRATSGLIRRVSTTFSSESSAISAAATAASAAAMVNASTVDISNRNSRANSYGSQDGVAPIDTIERDSLELRIRLGSAMAKIADLESKAQLLTEMISTEKCRADSAIERLNAQTALRESAFEQLATLQSEKDLLIAQVNKLSEEAQIRNTSVLTSPILSTKVNDEIHPILSNVEQTKAFDEMQERARIAEDTIVTLRSSFQALESRASDAEESLSAARAAAGRFEAAGESAEAEVLSLHDVIQRLESDATQSALRLSEKCIIEKELREAKDLLEMELREALTAKADKMVNVEMKSSFSTPQSPLQQPISSLPESAEVILELESRISRLKATGQARIDALKAEVATLQQSQSSLIAQLNDESRSVAKLKDDYSRVLSELTATQQSVVSASVVHQSEIIALKANLDEEAATILRLKTTGQARIDALKEEVSTLKMQLELAVSKSSSDINLARAEAKVFEDKFKEAQALLSQYIESVRDSDLIRTSEASAQSLSDSLTLERGLVSDLKNRLSTSEASAQSLSDSLTLERGLVSDLKNRLSTSEASAQSLSDSLTLERGLVSDLKNRLSTSEASAQSLSDSLTLERGLVSDLKNRLSTSEASAQSLSDSVTLERGLVSDLKNRLSTSEASAQSLSDLLSSERQTGHDRLSLTVNRLRHLETLQSSNEALQAKSDSDLKRLQREVEHYKTNFSELVEAGVKKSILEQQRSSTSFVAASGNLTDDEPLSPALDRKASSLSHQSHHSSTPQERNQLIILETDNFMMAAAIKRLEQQIDELKTENGRLLERSAQSFQELKIDADQQIMAAKLEAASFAEAAARSTNTVEQIIIEASDERGAAQLAIASARSERALIPSPHDRDSDDIIRQDLAATKDFSIPLSGDDATKEISRLQAETSALQAETSALQADVIRLESEILGLEETLAHNQAHAQAALEEALSAASTMRVEKNELQQKIRKLETDLELSTHREDSMKLSLASLEDKINDKTSRAVDSDISVYYDSKNEMIQIAASREEAVEGEYLALAALEASEARVHSLTTQLTKSRAEVRNASEEHAASIAEFNEVLQQVSTAVEQSANLREEAKQAVAANARLEEQLAAAISAKNDALKELELSEGSKTEDTAFLRSLLGESRIVAAQAVAAAASLEAQKAASLKQIATLAAAVEDADAGRLGSAGGIAQGLLTTLLGHQRDAAGLKAEVSSLKKFMVTARDELEKAGSVLKDFEALRVERNESLSAKEALEIEREHLLSTIEDLTEQTETLESECYALKLNEKAAKEVSINSQKSAEELSKVVSNLLSELDIARSSLTESQSRLKDAETEIVRINDETNFVSDSKKDNEEEVFALQVEIERLKENTEILRLERESVERESNATLAAVELELAVLKKSILESENKNEVEKNDAISSAAVAARDEAIGTINEVISALQTDSEEKISRLRLKLKTSEELTAELKAQVSVLQAESGRIDELINAIFELKTDLDAMIAKKEAAEERSFRSEKAVKRAISILRGETTHGSESSVIPLPSTQHERALAAVAILDAALVGFWSPLDKSEGEVNPSLNLQFSQQSSNQMALLEEIELWKNGTASTTPADAAVRFMTLAQSLNLLSAELESQISKYDKLSKDFEQSREECASLASEALQSRSQYEALLVQLPAVRDEFKRLEAEKISASASLHDLNESYSLLSNKVISLEALVKEREAMLDASRGELVSARTIIASLEGLVSSQSVSFTPQSYLSPTGPVRIIQDVPFSMSRPSALDTSMRAAEVALPTSPVASISTTVSPTGGTLSMYQSPQLTNIPPIPFGEHEGGALTSTPAARSAIAQLQRQLHDVQQQRDSLRLELTSLARTAIGSALTSNSNGPAMSKSMGKNSAAYVSPTVRHIFVRSSPLSKDLSPPSPADSSQKVNELEDELIHNSSSASKTQIIDSLRERVALLEIESIGSLST
jgi:chromosome segregation ATPase